MNALLENLVSRVAHGIATGAAPSSIGVDSQEDARVLPSVEEYLAKGQDLKRWWDDIDSRGGPTDRFPLERTYNRPARSYGFFGTAPVQGSTMPVMGNVQEMMYDQVRGPSLLNRDSSEWMWGQLREFVMKYFMRISSFRQPESYVDATSPTPPPALSKLTWCAKPDVSLVGFGFSQLFNKRMGTREVRPFSSLDRHAIVDQREIGSIWEWILLKVRIFDFSFGAYPFGPEGPELVFGLNEESFLVVHKDFVTYRDRPEPGILGEYGIGYSFVRSPIQGLLRYGPGEFDAAIELIKFRITEAGYITVRMIFISNRPVEVARVAIDPVGIGFGLANAFTMGFAKPFLAPARRILDLLPLRIEFDPVTTYVNLWNIATRGDAAQSLCISREQFEKVFLLQHFKQHYQTVTGSLLTWRQIPDWLDQAKLPPWVISGLSS